MLDVSERIRAFRMVREIPYYISVDEEQDIGYVNLDGKI